jgi:hypothetical protein
VTTAALRVHQEIDQQAQTEFDTVHRIACSCRFKLLAADGCARPTASPQLRES